MRVVLVCGGTGGHFYPGYALGRALRERGHELLFILRAGDPAAPRLDAEDLPHAEIALCGLPRALSPSLALYPLRAARAVLEARSILRAYRPAAVAGMGAYLTFPVALAARLRRIPVVLHEANAVLGLANRVCSHWAAALALGLPLEQPPPRAAELTGIPLRPELLEAVDRAHARRRLGLESSRPTVLVFGGSQGARALNRLAPPALASLGLCDLQVLHLSGREAEAEVRAAYERAGGGLRVSVRGYLDDMAAAYAAADLVISRSGASTVAELAAQRRAAILVPYPHATGGHQEANARVLERAGAAKLLREDGLSAESLRAELARLLGPTGTAARAAMEDAYARLALPPAERCVGALADLVERAAAG